MKHARRSCPVCRGPQSDSSRGRRAFSSVVVAMARLLIASLVASASATTTLELTQENFAQEVLESGKSAFIKFLAPW